MRDDVCMDTCVWCKNEINAGDEVWIERMIPDEPEYSAVFCGDEHASLWVAKPFDPAPEGYDDTWQDTVFVVGCLSVLALICILTAVGAVESIGWLVDVLG